MIRRYRRVLAVVTTCMALTILAGCGGGDSPTKPTTPTPTPPPTPVATTITVTPSSHTLGSIGATVQLTATVKDQNNNTMSGQTVTWTSGNMAVATVNAQGLVTAASNGTAQITARSGNASGRATVTVAEPVPTRITITVSPPSLDAIGQTIQLRAVVKDQYDNDVPDVTVTWTSSDDLVVTVNDQGLVTAVGNGSAAITARSGNLSGSVGIVVAQHPVTITIAPSAPKLTEAGQTVQLEATVLDRNEVPVEGLNVSWWSSNPEIATVTADGLVTAVSTGVADITAAITGLDHSVIVTVAIPSPDRPVLITLYNAMDGSNWDRQTNWLSDELIGTWDGVITDRSGRVTRLLLSNNRLAGEIPVELAQLSYLEDLHLSENQISGSIPIELVELQQLKRLHLDVNQLTGSIPSELSRLDHLTSIWLRRNQLSGEIPAELAELENLESLNIHDNNLAGVIPSEFGQMANLVSLQLHGNRLTGAIPVELANLDQLEFLNLGNNMLTGSIPPELGEFSNLEHLYLHENELTGEIPTTLSQLDQLRDLFLNNNNLTGEVPIELGQLQQLSRLRLDSNELMGNIPSTFGGLTNLSSLLLSMNEGLSGPLPSEILNLRLSRLLLQGTQICVPPTADFRMWLSGIMDAQGITLCEITYLPWTGLMVSPGKIAFVTEALPVPFELTTCIPLNNFEFMGASITVHEAKWQRRTDMDSPWMDLEDTIVTFQVCPLSPDEPGDYRLVGDATIQGERGLYASENFFTIE